MKARIAKKKLAALVGKTKPVAAKAVQAWINTHFDAQSELIYNRTGVDQACRFRDLFPRCLATSFEEFRECVDVVGEHHSKSVVLPVVRIQANGLTVVIRDNFHDVVMTIIGLREPPRAQVQAFIHRVCSAGFDTKSARAVKPEIRRISASCRPPRIEPDDLRPNVPPRMM